MRFLVAPLAYKEVGWRLAFVSTEFKNLLISASASALGIKTSASGVKTSGQKEDELASVNPTTQIEGDFTPERVSSVTNTSRNLVRPELSLKCPRDHHLFTAQQQKAERHELVSTRTMDSLLVVAKEGNWKALAMMLTGSPAKQNIGSMADFFVWLGRSGEQKASLALFELLKTAGESKELVSQYMQAFISSFATCYGAKQALMSLKAVEETVQMSPNIILFEDLISGFCSQGQLSHALDVLDEMQQRGLTLRSTTFSPLLKSFSKNLMLDEAFETLSAMRRLGVETSLANYNILIGACVRAGDMEKAYTVLTELQQQGIKPDTTSFNRIMKGFGQQKRLKRALLVLREMGYIGLEPNKDTYLVLLRACGTNKDLNEAMKIFKEVQELGLEADQTLLCAMIQVYVDNNQLDSALKLLSKSERKGTVIGVESKSQLLRGFALAERLEEALTLYEKLQESGKRPSPESVATLLVALGKVGRMDTMSKIFEESHHPGSWSEYPVAYRSDYLNMFCIHICLGYIRHKQPESAVRFLQQISKLGRTNNRILYDKIFLQIANSGSGKQGMSTLDAADGLTLLRALKDQGIQLSRIAHETLLDHCASLGKSKEAWEIVEEMEKENLPLNIMSKIRLFRVFVAARKEHDAEKVLGRISTFDFSDRDVRLLLLKIMELEFERSKAGSAKDVNTLSLRAIQKQLKEYVQSQKGNHQNLYNIST